MEKDNITNFEELKERISKNSNDILNLMVKYNQLLSLFLSITSANEKIKIKIDKLAEKIYAIKDWSISTISSTDSN